ncbi:hypothetical protein [Lactovum odontotermitis]
MLTKRQEKYWLVLFSLLGQSSASYEERRPLYIASDEIDSGKNFGNTMRKLIDDLEKIQQSQGGKLTPKVKELLDNAKNDYG